MPTGGDASYTPERFLHRYDELANTLGNLGSRVASMVVKYREGKVPPPPDDGLDREIEATMDRFHGEMEALKVHEALAAAMDLARDANGYVETREPWAQAKDPEQTGELDRTLATLIRALAVVTSLLYPVMPGKMAELARTLGLDEVPDIETARTTPLEGLQVTKGPGLFPRVEGKGD